MLLSFKPKFAEGEFIVLDDANSFSNGFLLADLFVEDAVLSEDLKLIRAIRF